VIAVDDIDEAPDWMRSGHYDDEPEIEQDETPPDENSLAFILQRAHAEIDELGGRERHRLSQVLGRTNYDKLMEKPAVSKAIDTWLSATPKTKNTAGRMLAIQIAKVAEEPKLVSRIENGLKEASEDYFDTGRSLQIGARQPTQAQVHKHRAAVNQRRNGQRVAYEKPRGVDSDDLAALAKRDDGTGYIQMRRKQMQKELRK
jgi:hypothetical protein